MILYDPRIHDWQGGLRNFGVMGLLLVWMVFLRPIRLRVSGKEGKENDWQDTIVGNNAARK